MKTLFKPSEFLGSCMRERDVIIKIIYPVLFPLVLTTITVVHLENFFTILDASFPRMIPYLIGFFFSFILLCSYSNSEILVIPSEDDYVQKYNKKTTIKIVKHFFFYERLKIMAITNIPFKEKNLLGN